MVPLEVVSGILIELPVKSLLRFKCVSHEWYSLINHPYFINRHLHRSIKTNRHDLRILFIERYSGTSKFLSLNSDSFNLDNPRKLIHPLKQQPQEDEYDGHIIFLGSCNGLVCLMNQASRKKVIWNISTGDYRFLPRVPRELNVVEGFHVYMYGLGHDSINDDYKLVRVARVKGAPMEPEIIGKTIVYSLRTNTWRRAEEIPYHLYPCYGRPSTFVCGALHYLAYHDSSIIIIAFDVGTEKCCRLELLDNMRDKQIDIGAFGGCLCVTENTPDDINGWSTKVWSMKEYGVKESWTMLFSFPTNHIQSLGYLAYSKIQDKLVAEAYCSKAGGQILILYYLKDKEIKDVDQLKIERAEICMESLVQL